MSDCGRKDSPLLWRSYKEHPTTICVASAGRGGRKAPRRVCLSWDSYSVGFRAGLGCPPPCPPTTVLRRAHSQHARECHAVQVEVGSENQTPSLWSLSPILAHADTAVRTPSLLC